MTGENYNPFCPRAWSSSFEVKRVSEHKEIKKRGGLHTSKRETEKIEKQEK
jgi:hypothetical protein